MHRKIRQIQNLDFLVLETNPIAIKENAKG